MQFNPRWMKACHNIEFNVHCFILFVSQVAWKLEETRKYYDMYNTLDSTLSFLQKEVKLLNSISENFHEAMRSSQSKAEFSKQFELIVKGVEVSTGSVSDNRRVEGMDICV